MNTRRWTWACAIGVLLAIGFGTSAHAQVGACCDCSAGCTDLTEAQCMAAGGTFLGAGNLCAVVGGTCTTSEPCQPFCNQTSANLGITILTTQPNGQPGAPFEGGCLIAGQELSFFLTVQVSDDSAPDVFCDIMGGELTLILPDGDVVLVAGFTGAPDVPQIGNTIGFGSAGPFGINAPQTYIVDPADSVGGQFNFVVSYQDGEVLCDCPDQVSDLVTENRILCLPEIDIQKSADTARVMVNTPTDVTYTYEVRNVGTSPTGDPMLIPDLTSVIVTDDMCPAGNPNSPLMLQGGDDGDGVLQPGEVWIYECMRTISATTTSPITNTAVVSGVAVALPPDGEPVLDVFYMDEDTATVFVNGPPDRGSGSEKGSVLIFSKVEIRWDAAGNVIQDTFIDLTNDWPADTNVQMYFINGDPPAAEGELGPGERAHAGWNWVDVGIELTANQPSYWSALTGLPGPGQAGVSPYTILDPSPDPLAQGRPAPDGSGDRVLRGSIYAWAIDEDGCQVSWNHLKGDATLVHYMDGLAWEYNAWAFQDIARSDPGTRIGECGKIRLDGAEFASPYGQLLLDFFASGSDAVSGGSPFQLITVDTDLTLHPVDVDLRQENHGPYTTKATFVIWNENETQFTGLHRCITCWDQTLISQYGNVANHFLIGNLQTDKGKARIDGLASTICSSNCCIPRDDGDHAGCANVDCQELVCTVNAACCTDTWDDECVWIAVDLCEVCDGINDDTPLLGVAAKHLFVGGLPGAASGLNLIGMGTEPTSICYDPVTGDGGPPPSLGPEGVREVERGARSDRGRADSIGR